MNFEEIDRQRRATISGILTSFAHATSRLTSTVPHNVSEGGQDLPLPYEMSVKIRCNQVSLETVWAALETAVLHQDDDGLVMLLSALNQREDAMKDNKKAGEAEIDVEEVHAINDWPLSCTSPYMTTSEADFTTEDVLNRIEARKEMSVGLAHLAVMTGNLGVLKQLVENGASATLRCRGNFPGYRIYNLCSLMWLAAYFQLPDVIRYLHSKGMSSDDWLSAGQGHAPVSTWQVAMTNVLTMKALCSGSGASPTPYEVCEALQKGSPLVTDIMCQAFRWTVKAHLHRAAFDMLCLYPECRKLLHLPCYSEEEFFHKEVYMYRLLLFVCESVFTGIGDLTVELLRHGANAEGLTWPQSRRFDALVSNARWQSSLYCTYELNGSTALRGRTGRCCENMLYKLRESYAGRRTDTDFPPCLVFQCSYTSVSVSRGYGVMPLLVRLCSTNFDLEDAVVKVLYQSGGTVPHVPSLDCLPIFDGILHNGPTCECNSVELSPAQRQVSFESLLKRCQPIALKDLCRSVIIRALGVAGRDCDAVKQLPLPSILVSFIEFKVFRQSGLR